MKAEVAKYLLFAMSESAMMVLVDNRHEYQSAVTWAGIAASAENLEHAAFGDNVDTQFRRRLRRFLARHRSFGDVEWWYVLLCDGARGINRQLTADELEDKRHFDQKYRKIFGSEPPEFTWLGDEPEEAEDESGQ